MHIHLSILIPVTIIIMITFSQRTLTIQVMRIPLLNQVNSNSQHCNYSNSSSGNNNLDLDINLLHSSSSSQIWMNVLLTPHLEKTSMPTMSFIRITIKHNFFKKKMSRLTQLKTQDLLSKRVQVHQQPCNNKWWIARTRL